MYYLINEYYQVCRPYNILLVLIKNSNNKYMCGIMTKV